MAYCLQEIHQLLLDTMPETIVGQNPSRAVDLCSSSPGVGKNKSDSILHLFLLFSPLDTVVSATMSH